MQRTIVIGDVHGCIEELRELLKKCEYCPDDEVVFVGDLVARGPDSLGVLALVRNLGARSVLGNHDHALLSWKIAIDSFQTPPALSRKHVTLTKL
jgi:calcineurin-like phosphoesterase family protein